MQKLLSEAGSIVLKYEMLARETGYNFNIFEIAGIGTRETVVCRVLAELLSPRGSHGQGGDYLEKFLAGCLQMTVSRADIDNAMVYCEYPANGRRIDIVIAVGSRFIPIEVKIYADEGEAQCYDYFHFARGMDSCAKVVYLTRLPAKTMPAGLAEADVITITFQNNILEWLNDCLTLPETITKAPIREMLLQFISTIKKFTHQPEAKPMQEIISLLSSPDNMWNAEIIANSIKACKTAMIFSLLSEIERGVGKEKLPYMDYASDNARPVKTFYDKDKATYPAINYHFKKINPTTDLWFRIEIGYEFLYAGLCAVVDNKQPPNWPLTPKECTQNNIEPDGKDWWSAHWDYLTNTQPNFRATERNDHFYQLFDKPHFDTYVNNCIKHINTLWKQWSKP